MKFNSVESSNLASVGYNAKTKTLGVMFKTTGPYFYLGVPEGIWNKFKASESKGQFFTQTIKPHYEFFQIDGLQNIDLGEQAPLENTA